VAVIEDAPQVQPGWADDPRTVAPAVALQAAMTDRAAVTVRSFLILRRIR